VKECGQGIEKLRRGNEKKRARGRYPEEDKDMFPPTNTEEFSAMMNPVSLPKTKFEEMFNN